MAFTDPVPRTSSGTRIPKPGMKLGRYELVDEIARGGMATVMLARATGPGGFDKLVALKLIHSRYASESAFVEMFLDEARIASRIQHPNVCSVFDFGDVAGTYYLAMDYLEGEPVSRLLKRLADDPDLVLNAGTIGRLCRIVADASEGLHAAHELRDERGLLLGVVHRDISPHNLFVTFDGGVRVVDFGIAQAKGKLHQTLTGVVKGKVAYMAPEQLLDHAIDRRADVWSLGVTLWELLTFARLFRRDSEAGTIRAVLEAEVPAPSTIRPAIPPELDEIVLGALERDPSRRTPSARDLGRALNAFLARGGQSVAMADIAEWMESLFPAEREAKRALVERARSSKESRDTLPSPAREEVSNSHMREAAGRVTETAPTEAERTRAPSATRSSSIRLPTEHRPLVLGAFILAALAAAAVVWAMRTSEQDTSATPEARDPIPIPSPSPSPSPPPTPTPGPPPSPSPTPSPIPSQSLEPRAPSSATTPQVPSTKLRAGTSHPRTGDAPMPVPDPPEAAGSREEGTASREETVAAPEAQAAAGTLDIATPGGWADVYVAGRRVGRSPCRVRLAAGRQVVELRPFGGGAAVTATVDVPPGGGARLVRAVESPP